jgi:hypothetical protein
MCPASRTPHHIEIIRYVLNQRKRLVAAKFARNVTHRVRLSRFSLLEIQINNLSRHHSFPISTNPETIIPKKIPIHPQTNSKKIVRVG